jgi:hypothetical protein
MSKNSDINSSIIRRPVIEVLKILEVAKEQGATLSAFETLSNMNPERTLKSLIEYGNVTLEEGRYYLPKYLPKHF